MLLIIIGHFALSAITALMGSKSKQERLACFIIAFFFPVGGAVTILVLQYSRNKRVKVIEEDPIKNTVVLFADRINVEKEINIVPLEETLLINEKKIKRQQLIDTLKKDLSSNIDMLKIALKDEDIETSHYAASAVFELRRKLDLKIQAISVLYENNKSDQEVSREYARTLEEYLNSKLLEENRNKQLMATYSNVLEGLLSGGDNKPEHYTKLIGVLLERGNFERAGRYCRAYLEEHENEEAYLANLKYYYLLRDKKTFNLILKRLQKSPVKLSNKGLNIVRFWLDGVK